MESKHIYNPIVLGELWGNRNNEKILIIKENTLPEVIQTESVEGIILEYFAEKSEILNTEEYIPWMQGDENAYAYNTLRTKDHAIVYVGGGDYCVETFNRALYAVGSNKMIGGMICFKTFICCSITKDGKYAGLSDQEIKMIKRMFGKKSIDYAKSFFTH